MTYGPLPQRDRALEQLAAFVDLVLVPQRPVLVVEQDELAVPEAGGAARVVDQHEREQGVRFGLVGHELASDRPRRIASRDRSTRPSPQPSLKIR